MKFFETVTTLVLLA